MAVLALVTTLAVPFLLGAGILRALGISFAEDRVAYGGWAWVVGSLGCAAILFAWLLTGPPPSHPWILDGLCLALAALLALLGRGRRPVAPVETHRDSPRRERILFALAVALVLAVTVQRISLGTLDPITGGDEANLWAYRGKLLFTGGVFGELHQEFASGRFFHPDYPLFNPVLQAWTFAHFGAITHVANRLPLQMFALPLALIGAGALRRAVRPAVAALFLLLIPTLGFASEMARRAMSDGLVAVGALMALDAFSRWKSDGTRRWIWLGSLALGAMAWSKHGGTLLLFAVLCAAAVSRIGAPRPTAAGLRDAARWLSIPLLVVATNWAVNLALGVGPSFKAQPEDQPGFAARVVGQFGERVEHLLGFAAREIWFSPRDSNLVLGVFLILAAAAFRSLWRSSLRLPTLALLFAVSGYLAVFLGLPDDMDYFLVTASRRVFFHVTPAALIWIALVVGLLAPSLAPAGSRERVAGRLANVLAFGVLAIALWRGASALVSMGRELRGPTARTWIAVLSDPESERIRKSLLAEDREDGLPPRSHQELYDALARHVPRDATVLALSERGGRWDRVIPRVRALLFPMMIYRIRHAREPSDRSGRTPVFVLDFDGAHRAALSAELEPVASGASWALWH